MLRSVIPNNLNRRRRNLGTGQHGRSRARLRRGRIRPPSGANCINGFSPPPVPFRNSLDGAALDDAVSKGNEVIGGTPSSPKPNTRFPSGFSHDVVVVKPRFSPKEDLSKLKCLLLAGLAKETLVAGLPVKTKEMLRG